MALGGHTGVAAGGEGQVLGEDLALLEVEVPRLGPDVCDDAAVGSLDVRRSSNPSRRVRGGGRAALGGSLN